MTETLSYPNRTDPVGESQIAAYRRDGYVVLPRLFAADEIAILRRAAERDMPGADVLTKADQDGNKVSLKMWNGASEDIYGMFSRNERTVLATERLIGARVYLYSAKMILKNAHDGGAWEWHQDYGYWYNNGCLMPDMASCSIAVDPNTAENGCLQVLRGSHHLGRLDHVREKEQFVADSERVKVALTRFEKISVPLEPGDAIVFHCNLLHRSDANNSDRRRWNFICSYNAADNRPYKHERAYGHDGDLKVVPATEIRAFAAKNPG
jgi:ectoine hydroxylase-related dioxygenase (phytanoyl-CoA dioxygenase family)